jgi:hypothetical protein
MKTLRIVKNSLKRKSVRKLHRCAPLEKKNLVVPMVLHPYCGLKMLNMTGN